MPKQGPGGERTEQATPKKKRDAREKGQVFKSNEVIIAGSMILMVAILSLAGGYVVNNIMGMMKTSFINVPETASVSAVRNTFFNLVWRFLLIMLPILGAALAGALITNYAQVGFLFTTKAMMPKFSRISIIEGFKRIFSTRTLVELVKSIVKIAVLGVVAYNEYQSYVTMTPNFLNTEIKGSISSMVTMLFNVAYKLCLALLIMAPFDWFFQWWKHRQDLMMSKQEIKDEYKLSEGDPQIKGRIRQKQREMSAMRMMAAVADADVVITNPTHFAVALKYDDSVHDAPIVVAKGKDHMARRIREQAAECGVERVENVALARQLYFFCEIGDPVPEEVYQAVAEILAYIYRMKNGQRGAYSA
ncbi:flagellar biosynthesis protein FlhB [Eubacteriales bacterium OttesenSCG-928-M02]|nr:flagellar biosynthesis protein FlhB [Eubacteriales bacterium OttesenSCG-928-M02]